MVPPTTIAPVLSSILPLIISEIKKKLKKKAELEKAVYALKDQLPYVKGAILEHSTPGVHNDVAGLKTAWIKSLRRLAYDMEDCIESFNFTKKFKVAKKESRKKFEENIPKLIDALTDANNLYKQLSTQPDHPPRREGGASSSKNSWNPLIQKQDQGFHLVDLNIVGKEDIIRELLVLMGASSDERIPQTMLKVLVISIVGFSGLGKPLLGKQVYNNVVKSRQNDFPRHVLIDATTKKKEKVLEAILQKLTKQGVQQHRQQAEERFQAADPSSSKQGQQNLNMDSYKTHFKSLLGENRYFIVIDGVQSEEMGKYITSAFPDNSKGSRIVITMTVEGTVMDSCSAAAGHMSKMWPLEAEESVKMFLEEALKAGQSQTANDGEGKPSPTMENICDVQLALVSISEDYDGEVKLGDWVNRMKLQVLPHCYDSLSKHLQACLLYFSMFPRGCHVRRGPLVRRWLAEGEDLGCTSGDKGIENLQGLLKRNFVWPLQTSMSNGSMTPQTSNVSVMNPDDQPQVKTCQSPGLVLDYIISESKSEEFIMLSCDEGETSDIRRLSLRPGDSSLDGERKLREQSLPRLRTLAIFRTNQQIKHVRFDKCDVLRVLDLEGCSDLSKGQVKEICEFLMLLRYLSLPASIEKVPIEVARLKLLQTLDLRKNEVVTVPVDVLKLPYLEHLLGKCELNGDYSWNKELRKFLSGENKDEYSRLETLAGFVIGSKKGFAQLVQHMDQLSRKLKVWFDPGADSSSFATDLAKGIKKFCDRASRDANDKIGHASLKINLQEWSPKLLDSLDVTGCKIFYLKVNCSRVMKLRQLPSFIANQDVITKLCLSWTNMDGSKILANLGNLEGLKYLKLEADNIEGSIVRIQFGRIHREILIKSEPQFKSLQRMCIVAREKLDTINIEPGALPKLESLHLIHKYLDSLSADKISGLKTLKEVALHPEIKDKHAWRNVAPQVLFSVNP